MRLWSVIQCGAEEEGNKFMSGNIKGTPLKKAEQKSSLSFRLSFPRILGLIKIYSSGKSSLIVWLTNFFID